MVFASAFVAGAVAAVGVNRALDVHLAQTRPQVEAEPIFVALRSLPQGAPVTVWDVALRDWPKAMLPTAALRARDSFEGCVLKYPLREGQPLLAVQLVQADRASGAAATQPTTSAEPAFVPAQPAASRAPISESSDPWMPADPAPAPAMKPVAARPVATVAAVPAPARPVAESRPVAEPAPVAVQRDDTPVVAISAQPEAALASTTVATPAVPAPVEPTGPAAGSAEPPLAGAAAAHAETAEPVATAPVAADPTTTDIVAVADTVKPDTVNPEAVTSEPVTSEPVTSDTATTATTNSDDTTSTDDARAAEPPTAAALAEQAPSAAGGAVEPLGTEPGTIEPAGPGGDAHEATAEVDPTPPSRDTPTLADAFAGGIPDASTEGPYATPKPAPTKSVLKDDVAGRADAAGQAGSGEAPEPVAATPPQRRAPPRYLVVPERVAQQADRSFSSPRPAPTPEVTELAATPEEPLNKVVPVPNLKHLQETQEPGSTQPATAGQASPRAGRGPASMFPNLAAGIEALTNGMRRPTRPLPEPAQPPTASPATQSGRPTRGGTKPSPTRR